MTGVLAVGTGGFIGAVLRYLVGLFFKTAGITSFPLATLTVNVIGGILIGFIFEMTKSSIKISDNLKLFLTTGILGGLTTFSTFSYETFSMISAGDMGHAGLNTILNVVLSIGGVYLGTFLAKLIK